MSLNKKKLEEIINFEKLEELFEDMIDDMEEDFDPEKPIMFAVSMKFDEGRAKIDEIKSLDYEEEEEETLFSLNELKDSYVITVELLDVDEKDVLLESSENSLIIHVKSNPKLSKKIDFNKEINAKNITTHFKNGILEITCFKKTNRKFAEEKGENRKNEIKNNSKNK